MSTIEEVFQLAMEHHQAGRLPQAEQLYRQILSAAPQHADSQHLLGLLAHQSGHTRRGDRIHPQRDQAESLLRDLLFEPGGRLSRSEAARRGNCLLSRSIRLQPDFAEVHYNLGIALRLRRQLSEAVASCREAIRLNPAYAEAYNNLSTARARLGRRDEARAEFERALELKPDLADAYFNLGNLLRQSGKPREASPFCERAVELQPQSSAARSNLGAVFQAMGRISAAPKRSKPHWAWIHATSRRWPI